MAWRWALTRVPWRAILAHAPTLVDAARRVRRRGAEPDREPAAGEPEALRRALGRLEQRAMQQAALVEDLAKEVRELTIALEVLRARLRLAFVAAGIAAALALAALVLGR